MALAEQMDVRNQKGVARVAAGSDRAELGQLEYSSRRSKQELDQQRTGTWGQQQASVLALRIARFEQLALLLVLHHALGGGRTDACGHRCRRPLGLLARLVKGRGDE